VAVGVRTVDASIADRLPGLAAEIAFWVLLSLPSLLLSMLAAAGLLIDGQDWQDQLIQRAVEVSSVVLTDTTIDVVVVGVLEQLIEGGGIGLISFGFVTAVWTASRAVRVVLTTITLVSNREGLRKGWKDRLLGFGITFGALLVGGVLAPLLVAGPNFGETLARWIGTDLTLVAEVWRRAYWPTVVIAATLALSVLYHLGIPGRTPWRRDVPGAVLATGFWLIGSAGLRLYGLWILDSDSVYGPLAGPIVALLWLWLTGFAVLLGAQLNAQISRGDESELEPA
jgi:membrane protein